VAAREVAAAPAKDLASPRDSDDDSRARSGQELPSVGTDH